MSLMDELRELAVRAALFDHLDELLNSNDDDCLHWEQTASFSFNGERISVRQVRGRGINKPANLNGALSITTAFTPFGKTPPYDDMEGDDGYPRYKYEGSDPNLFTNRSLRICMEYGLPIVYFLGVREGVYKPVYPMYVIGDDPQSLQFTLWFNRAQLSSANSNLSPQEKRYVSQETRRRLHQPIFREQVLNAYGERCAVCSLRHSQLLDAAHIISDAKPMGDPVVQNGMALCKIHHAAYDRNLMGIRPDYEIRINSDLLQEIDGPMLKYGLQAMHGILLRLPSQRQLYPDPDRLEVRFSEFKAIG